MRARALRRSWCVTCVHGIALIAGCIIQWYIRFCRPEESDTTLPCVRQREVIILSLKSECEAGRAESNVVTVLFILARFQHGSRINERLNKAELVSFQDLNITPE